MLSPSAAIVLLLAVGVPVSVLRLWFVWWAASCDGCGFAHRTCECPPRGPTMRPRR